MNSILIYFFLFYSILKKSLKNFYFFNNLLILDSFWNQYSYLSIFRKKNLFITEYYNTFDHNLELIFREDLINFLFSNKKKFFFNQRKFYLRQLKNKYLKDLGPHFLKKKAKNKEILKIMRKIWRSYEFRFSRNKPLKMFIQKKIKTLYSFDNFLKAWTVLNHWKKYQKFKVFNKFKLTLLKKKVKKKTLLKFLIFYLRNYKKIFWKKLKRRFLLRKYRSRHYFLLRKAKKDSFRRFIPRNYNNLENSLSIFPKKLQLLFAPYKIFLQKNYSDLFSFFKNISYTKFLELYKKNFPTYYFLKFKKKRSNFYFTIYSNKGDIIYYLSSGRFFKLNFQKRNRKLRNSLFNLSLMVKNMCKILKKKKIFVIHTFLKPRFLKLYLVRRIFYSFLFSGIKLMSFKSLVSFPHNRFTKNKKIRRI